MDDPARFRRLSRLFADSVASLQLQLSAAEESLRQCERRRREMARIVDTGGLFYIQGLGRIADLDAGIEAGRQSVVDLRRRILLAQHRHDLMSQRADIARSAAERLSEERETLELANSTSGRVTSKDDVIR